MEEHVITRKLYLPIGGLQVSQALPMGTNNHIQLQVRVESGRTGSVGTAAVATVQTSQDMENWTSSSLNVTLSNAPMTGTVSTSTAFIAAPWIRIRYVGGSNIAYIINAVVRLLNA